MVPQAEAIKNEELLDGIYVIRSSEPAEKLTAASQGAVVQAMGLVERAFRCVKGLDLLVRPTHHRTAEWVRTHILLCPLAITLKKKTHRTTGGLPVQSFRTLLAHLGTHWRNTCVVSADPHQTPFHQVTAAEALRLILMETETGTWNFRKLFSTIDILLHHPGTSG
jgi:hypothetical protein